MSCEAPRDLPPPPFPLPSDLPDLISHTSSFPLFLQQAEHYLSSTCMHLSSPVQRMSSPPGYLPYRLYTYTFSVAPSLVTLFVSLFCKIYLFFSREREGEGTSRGKDRGRESQADRLPRPNCGSGRTHEILTRTDSESDSQPREPPRSPWAAHLKLQSPHPNAPCPSPCFVFLPIATYVSHFCPFHPYKPMGCKLHVDTDALLSYVFPVT